MDCGKEGGGMNGWRDCGKEGGKNDWREGGRIWGVWRQGRNRCGEEGESVREGCRGDIEKL